jgi:GT2 family glycosyltransferase
MIETQSQEAHKTRILAVLVLYRIAPEQSSTFSTLVHSLSKLSSTFVRCIVYDNSPEAHLVPVTPFPCEYRHDPSNPGLAAAYQAALDQAQLAGIPWLLLLDQDTVLTTEYLAELMRTADELEQRNVIAAIVPKLMQDGIVLSPHWPHGAGESKPFSDRSGLLEPDICVYNSGALLRVESVLACGGFPQDFPLDYLDHAMFASLHARGGRVFLLSVSLLHHLDSKAANMGYDLKTSVRLQGMLLAESKFYRQYGSTRERNLMWCRRLRLAAGMLSRLQFRSLAALIRSTSY